VIESFGDKATEDLFHGRKTKRTRGFPADLLGAALRKLGMINAAHRLDDLKAPPANRLEALKGDLAGLQRIRINGPYRIVFRWSEGNASEVRIVDYP
jgi:proteic killer suppression protein